jgi:putative acetyltransferase
MPAFTIRPEGPDDAAEIRTAVVAAFGTEAEGDLVDNIRASQHYIPELSLVAVQDGHVVGHVMISRVHLVDGDHRIAVHSLAPLAVAPEAQGAGIGKALVRDVIARADAMGLPLVLLEGSPRYYGNLGFEHSVNYGIHFDLPDWAPPEAAQLYRLANFDPSITGRVEYPPAFDVE